VCKFPTHIRACSLAGCLLYYTKEHFNVLAVHLKLLVLLHPARYLQDCLLPLTATTTQQTVTYRPHSSPDEICRHICFNNVSTAGIRNSVAGPGAVAPDTNSQDCLGGLLRRILDLALGGRLRSQNKPATMSGLFFSCTLCQFCYRCLTRDGTWSLERYMWIAQGITELAGSHAGCHNLRTQ
jgi:hypothetical protein